MMLAVAKIRTDGGTQIRAAMDEATVARYVATLSEGGGFQSIIVYYDGADHWLADGFHRVEAHRVAGVAEVLADIRQGTRRDAILYSVGANSEHGLPRSRADARRAVETLLRDGEWRAESDRWIAEKCKVDHKTVGRARAELEAVGEVPHLTHRTGADGKSYPASKPKLAPVVAPPCAPVEHAPTIVDRLAAEEPLSDGSGSVIRPVPAAPSPRETPKEAALPAHAFDSRSGEQRLCEALRSYFGDVMSEWPEGAPLTALLHEVEFMRQQVVSYMKVAK